MVTVIIIIQASNWQMKGLLIPKIHLYKHKKLFLLSVWFFVTRDTRKAQVTE